MKTYITLLPFTVVPGIIPNDYSPVSQIRTDLFHVLQETLKKIITI